MKLIYCSHDDKEYLDRGLHYGDGIFTTMLVHQQHIIWLKQHQARLIHDLTRLELPLFDTDGLEKRCRAIAKNTDKSKQFVLKILISRGVGERGYFIPKNSKPHIYIWLTEYHQQSTTKIHQGIEVGIAEYRLATDPYLAGIKHCNRLSQIILKQALAMTTYDDLLALNDKNYLIEATSANFFWLNQQNHWYTAPIDGSGISGIVRGILIEKKLAKEMHLSCAALDQIQSAFICNTLIGIIPIKKITDSVITHQSYELNSEPSMVLQQRYNQLVIHS